MNEASKARARDRFLDCLQRLVSARAACRAAGLPRSTLCKWREALEAAGGPRPLGTGGPVWTRILESG